MQYNLYVIGAPLGVLFRYLGTGWKVSHSKNSKSMNKIYFCVVVSIRNLVDSSYMCNRALNCVGLFFF